MAEIIYETIKDSDGVECFIKRGDLVRCKDCGNKKCWEAGNVVCGIDGTPHMQDWFCACGKRKESRCNK